MRRSMLVFALVVLGTQTTFAAPASPSRPSYIADLQPWAGMGIGGLVSWLMLTWKRGDDKTREDERKSEAQAKLETQKAHDAALAAKDQLLIDALERHADQLAGVNENVLGVVVANTKAMVELAAAINYQTRQRRKLDPDGSSGH